MKRSSTTKTSSDKFQPGDRVFAKVKGWPPWPAKVLNRMEGKGESYNVIFCGTYDTRVLKLDCLFAYDKANRAEYGKPKNRNRWKEGMEELDKNIPISEKGRVEDEKPSGKEKEVKTPARKGTKVEEEKEKTPAQEPVKAATRRGAKAEEEKAPVQEPARTPGRKAAKVEEDKPPEKEKEPAKTPGRKAAAKAEEEKPPAKEPPKTVGRKSASAAKVEEEEPPAKEASKTPTRKAAKTIAPSKRDSISSGPSEPESSTPAASTSTSTPTAAATDSVRRSGRQAKPKRFADDIIATPISRKSTPKTAEVESDEVAASSSTPAASEETSTPSSPPVKKRKVDKAPKKAVEESTKESEDASEMDISLMATQVIPVSPQKSTSAAAAATSATALSSSTPQLELLSSPPIKKRKAVLKATVKSTPPPLPTAKASEPVKPDSPSKKIAASISYEGNVVAIKSPAVIPTVSPPPSKSAVLSLSSPSKPSILKKRKAEKSPVKVPPPPIVVNKESEDTTKKLATPIKESVKPTDSSVKKTPLSMEAMMAAVSSIKAPVIPSSPVKPAVASPALTLITTPESSASPATGATAVKKRKVDKTYSRTPTTQADKGTKEGEDTAKKAAPSHSEFAVKPSESNVKKAAVSFEAMMAAVSSIKTPFTPKLKNKSGTASEQQKIKLNIESGGVQQPKLISAASALAQAAGQQQPMSVEILRQKTKSGGTTVVVVQQQKGEDGEEVVEAVGGGDGDDSDADSYDEYMYFDREFEFEHEEDIKADREFERFHIGLKKFLQLPGRWTMGGVQWDPQGKRKVILISEPEIPPNGRPIVKRCLQFFEDKSIRVFIDQMDMTDVFGMTCYAEKEDVASLVVRVADASSCCGVPEMVVDDLVYFPDVRKRNTSYFAPNCPGVIANDEYDPICTACKEMQILVKECRRDEKLRLQERRIRSEEKMFEHPFGKALYNMFDDLVDETDPSKPKKKRTKETFFRKFLHDTRLKVNGDSARTERVYIEKPISVDSVSQSFQDIVSKLGFNVPNAKKRPSGGLLPRPSAPTQTSTPAPRSSAVSRIFPGSTSNLLKMHQERKQSLEHISMPFAPGSSFTLDDGQEYELIGEVEPGQHEFVEMKATPSANQQQQQYEIIEVDDETLARLQGSKNQMVMLPESTTAGSSIVTSSGFPITTRIDANDPNLSQILKAINTSHGFKVS